MSKAKIAPISIPSTHKGMQMPLDQKDIITTAIGALTGFGSSLVFLINSKVIANWVRQRAVLAKARLELETKAQKVRTNETYKQIEELKEQVRLQAVTIEAIKIEYEDRLEKLLLRFAEMTKEMTALKILNAVLEERVSTLRTQQQENVSKIYNLETIEDSLSNENRRLNELLIARLSEQD